jgi:RHS repeat-associated protein
MSSSVPIGWPGNTTPPTTGPPIFVDSIPSNDSVKAGFGFHDPGHFPETGQAFYHPDHLGSSWYITNVLGKTSQHLEYTPFGETFIEENTNSFKIAYLFNGEGRDETGYYQYANRYYDPALSQWLSIDPDDDPMTLTEGYMMDGNQNMQGGQFGFSLGGAEVSETVFGDASAGLQLDPLGENAGGGKNKNEGNERQGPKIGKGKPAANKANPRTQNVNVGQRRGQGKGRNQFGNNNMLYQHKIQQKKKPVNDPSKNKNNQGNKKIVTRPRR